MKKYLILTLAFIALLVGVGCRKTPTPPQPPAELNTNETDALRLTVDFAGKSFPEDGIGEVTLLRNIDGDTIHVLNDKREVYQIRFLGINTPESTGRIEPWGKAASDFTKSKTATAHSIVLEGGEIDSTGNRVLGFVWYKLTETDEYRLLNLELVELAYTHYTKGIDKYDAEFSRGEKNARATERRVHGEDDPDFNYDRTTVVTTIHSILTANITYKSGTNFELKVRLVRTTGSSAYLQDVNDIYEEDRNGDGETETYHGRGGAYVYAARVINFYRDYQIGDEFTIIMKFEDGNFGKQFTDIQDVSAVTGNSEPVIETLEGGAITHAALLEREGSVVQLKGLKVLKVNDKTSSSGHEFRTVETQTATGVRIDLYFGGSKHVANPYSKHELPVVGKTYDFIGGVSEWEYAEGGVQLKIGDAPARDILGNFKPTDAERIKDIVEVK